jgi:hypothetical protein
MASSSIRESPADGQPLDGMARCRRPRSQIERNHDRIANHTIFAVNSLTIRMPVQAIRRSPACGPVPNSTLGSGEPIAELPVSDLRPQPGIEIGKG